MLKQVNQVLYAYEVEMGDIRVRQPFPTQNVDALDPFLLLHHHRSELPSGTDVKMAGVGPHPHRGFTPVTFIFEGSVHHRDSRGNSDVIDAGGVQWMDAGMGIVHSERPSKEFAAQGGPFEIIQLWINLPKADKMIQPRYQAFQESDLPCSGVSDGDGKVYVYAGSLGSLQGPLRSRVKVTAARIDLMAKAGSRLSVPSDESTSLYVLFGKVRIKGHGLVEAYNLCSFDKKGTEIEIEAIEHTRILLISGMPIDEPVSKYGPFVMTNQTEIMQAMRDYQMGKMGILIEEF